MWCKRPGDGDYLVEETALVSSGFFVLSQLFLLDLSNGALLYASLYLLISLLKDLSIQSLELATSYCLFLWKYLIVFREREA